jgi:hypothetical protein
MTPTAASAAPANTSADRDTSAMSASALRRLRLIASAPLDTHEIAAAIDTDEVQ